jgi:hypothetical protein
MENNTEPILHKNTGYYPCKHSKKWIKIENELKEDAPFHTEIIRCGKCRSYAILNFVHEEMGDYYGPGIHNECEGIYVYLCTKRKEHVIKVNEDDE